MGRGKYKNLNIFENEKSFFSEIKKLPPPPPQKKNILFSILQMQAQSDLVLQSTGKWKFKIKVTVKDTRSSKFKYN